MLGFHHRHMQPSMGSALVHARQRLLQLRDALPWVTLQALRPRQRLAHGKASAALIRASSSQRSGTATRRNRARAATTSTRWWPLGVAQPVDEDDATALGLAHRRHIAIRLLLCHCLRKGLAERLRLVPAGLGLQRYHHAAPCRQTAARSSPGPPAADDHAHHVHPISPVPS